MSISSTIPDISKYIMAAMAEELKKLNELKEKGAITQDEYDSLKAKILADFKAAPAPAQMNRNLAVVGGAVVAGAAVAAVTEGMDVYTYTMQQCT